LGGVGVGAIGEGEDGIVLAKALEHRTIISRSDTVGCCTPRRAISLVVSVDRCVCVCIQSPDSILQFFFE
jgi:hypothetical protein